MPLDEIPEQVRVFLSQCVGSLDELGMLLVLMASATKWWDIKGARDELGVSNARGTIMGVACRLQSNGRDAALRLQRLMAFLLILLGMIDKNRRRR